MARGRAKAAGGPVEGPWALPEGWRWERLGDLGTWFGGGTPSKAKPEFWSDGTIPWVSPKDMKRAVIDSTEDRITAAAVAGSSTKLVAAGSVLCVMRSGILRHTFPVAVAAVDVTLNQDMRALTPPPSIAPHYLAHYLRYTGRTVLDTSSKDGTTVNSIEAERLDQHPVPVPPIQVQRAIVARIDDLFADLDDGEAALARARTDLGTWRKALLKAAVTGELTADWRAAEPPAETGADLLARILDERRARWLAEPRNKGKRYVEPEDVTSVETVELPKNWVWATMNQLSWSSGYGTSEKCTSEQNGTPVLRITNIKQGSISLSDLKYSRDNLDLRSGDEVDQGDLLLIRTNGSDDLIGRAALVLDRPVTRMYFASYLIRFRLIGPKILLLWLAIILESPLFRHFVLRSIASSAGQYNISMSKIERFALPIPPMDELKHILHRHQSVAGDAGVGEDFISTCSTAAPSLRQSILAAAFRGELVR